MARFILTAPCIVSCVTIGCWTTAWMPTATAATAAAARLGPPKPAVQVRACCTVKKALSCMSIGNARFKGMHQSLHHSCNPGAVLQDVREAVPALQPMLVSVRATSMVQVCRVHVCWLFGIEAH